MTVVSLLREAGVEVYTRSQWGSPMEVRGEYAKRATQAAYQLARPAKYHFLHITVTRDGNSVQEGFDGARQVEGYGYTTPPMVSYQMLVTNEGKAFEGQNYGVKGTHTVNDKNVPGFPRDLNMEGYAVALMQDVGDEVTDIQVWVIAACFAAAEIEGWVVKGAPVYPHRMFAAKACPGDRAMARLNEIENLKNTMVREGIQMLTKEDVLNAVPRAPITVNLRGPGPEDNETMPLEWVLRKLLNDHAALATAVESTRRLAEAAAREAAIDNYNGPSAARIANAVKAILPESGGPQVTVSDIEAAVANVLKKGTAQY